MFGSFFMSLVSKNDEHAYICFKVKKMMELHLNVLIGQIIIQIQVVFLELEIT
jgi:hypothetical protein